MNGNDRRGCNEPGCAAPIIDADGWCYAHNPLNREQVLESVSRAGRGHGDPRLADLREALQELYVEVKDNGYETTRANTLVRIVTAQIDIVKAEREVALDALQAEFEELKREIGIVS